MGSLCHVNGHHLSESYVCLVFDMIETRTQFHVLMWAGGVAEQDYGEKIKVLKCEVDDNPKLVEKYKVYGLPTLVVFDKGQEILNREGAITRPKLQVILDEKIAVSCQAVGWATCTSLSPCMSSLLWDYDYS